MATYTSQVKNVYYQSTSGGKPSVPRKTELGEISDALAKFSETVTDYSKVVANQEKKDAQNVFDTLKSQGITDPDEIQALIDKNDPRIAPLKKRWANSVIDVNFGLAHALDDGNRITESIYQQIGTDDSLWHTIDLENEFNNLQRDFSNKSNSYVRAYTEAFDKIKLEFQGKKLEGDAQHQFNQKKSAKFTHLADIWQKTNGLDWETRWDVIMGTGGDYSDFGKISWFESTKQFLPPDVANEMVIDFLEDQIKITSDPKDLVTITKMLTTKRSKSIPSFRDDIKYRDKAVNILSEIVKKRNKILKGANATAAIAEGKIEDDLYVSSDGSTHAFTKQEKLEGWNNWYKAIVGKVTEMEKEYYNHPPNRATEFPFPKELMIMSELAKLTRANGTKFYQWQDTLDKGLGVINNASAFQVESVPEFLEGYKLFKQLKFLGQDNNPNADYLTGKAELFYETVYLLETVGGREPQEAVAKAWQLINTPTGSSKIFEEYSDTIRTDVVNKFNGFFDWEGTDANIQVNEAIRLTKILMSTGVGTLDSAIESAVKMVGNSYIKVDGQLYNKRMFPMNVTSEEITKRSKWISEKVAKELHDNKITIYDAEDLVLAPYSEGGLFVVVERATGIPVVANGKVYAFKKSEVFHSGDSSIASMIKEENLNKSLKWDMDNVVETLDSMNAGAEINFELSDKAIEASDGMQKKIKNKKGEVVDAKKIDVKTIPVVMILPDMFAVKRVSKITYNGKWIGTYLYEGTYMGETVMYRSHMKPENAAKNYKGKINKVEGKDE